MGICNSSTKEDVKADRERTRGAQQGGSQQQQQQQRQQQLQQQQQQQQQQDRQQIAPQSLHPAPAQGIPTGSYRDANGIPRSVARDQPIAASYNRDDDGATYGTSYTNRKTREYDLLNDIVKQTSRNFIDVSAASRGVLDEEDLVERGQKYVKNLSDIPASHSAVATVSTSSFGRYYNSMELPQPSKAIVQRAAAPGTSGLGAGLVAHGAATAVAAPASVDYAALIALLSTAHIAPNDIEFITSASSGLSSALLESNPVHDPPLKIVLTFEELLNDK